MSGRRAVLWEPPGGAPPVQLDDPANGYILQWNLTGLMRPTYRVITAKHPGRVGTQFRSVAVDERRIDIGIDVYGRTRNEFRHRAQQLMRATRPTEGLGRLRILESDGSTRWIDCIYLDGAEGEETPAAGGPHWWKLVLTFLAPDPFARSMPVDESWPLAKSGVGWFPIIPIRLGASGVGGRRTVRNPGDVECFPVIKVRGPGSDLVAVNRTTGKSAHLDYTIPASGLGSTVTIDTRRGAQRIVDGFGNNLFEYLTDEDPSLWSLLPGDNDIEIRLADTGPGSEVTVSFDPLYESL